MRLPRPYIPLSVRIAVAHRQLFAISGTDFDQEFSTRARRLSYLLTWLRFWLDIPHTGALQLDHDPALALRKFNKRTGKYKPDANDPDYLKYRPVDSHRTKTFLRGEHGQRSDVAQITRERRRRRPAKAKRKIRSRGFQRGNRPFPQRKLTSQASHLSRR